MNSLLYLQLQHLYTLNININKINSVAISPDNKYLVAGGGNDISNRAISLQVWNLNTGESIYSLQGHTSDINSIAISPDSQKIVSVSGDSSVRIWDLSQGKEIYFDQEKDSRQQVVYYAVVISFDGQNFITANVNQLKIWELKSGKKLDNLLSNQGRNYIYSLAVSPDGKTLFSGGGRNSIQIWDLQTKQEIYKITGHSSMGRSLCVSPDCKTLVSGGDQRIKVWDLTTYKARLSFYGHADLVRGLVITPDGNTLISGGDRFIKIWDLNTGKKLYTIEAHDDAIRALALSNDGTILASGGVGGKVKVWRLLSA